MPALEVALLTLLLVVPHPVPEPTVRAVNIRGLQVGGTTTLTIDGDEFGKSPRLLLPFPAKQTLGPKSTDKQAVFDVALDASVTPGYHHLRVATEGGVSLPVVIGVDALPQKPFAAKVESLPVALHGSVGGATVLETTFTGKAGQAVTVEVEAQRLGGGLRPVLHLYSPKKLQLGWAWGMPWLHGDARLQATLPEDGTYTVTLHDAEYAAPAAGFFRLKIGSWRYADRVFPPAVGPDTKTVTVIGDTTTTVERPAIGGPFAILPWPGGGTWSGPRPFVEVSARPEFLADGSSPPTLPAPPFGLCGRTPQQFRVPVTPNTKVRFEVFAERIGSPLDLALAIKNEAGTDLARAEDSPGTLDPVLEYAVPDKVEAITVAVVDSRGGSGPPGVYRLVADPMPATGDFRLTTPTQRVALPAGGIAVVPVYADRHGFAGKIELHASDLPAGVRMGETAIPADADGTLVTLRRDKTAAEPTVVTLRGRGGPGLHRAVFLKNHPLERLQPWLASELAVAPTIVKATDFAVEWRGRPDSAALVPGLKLALPVKVTRLDPAAPVRLTLLTSQAPPLANGQPNPAAAIRPEKPVELAAKVSDGELVALLPPDLPASAYEIAIQADVLSADKQRVLATAFTPVRMLPVRPAVVVRLANPRIDVRFDPKKPGTFDLAGEVVRAQGVTGDVALTVTGLPPGYAAAPLTVKPGETKFAVKVTLPPTPAAGDFTGVKLSATVTPDAKQPGVRVKARDVEVSLSVEPAPPKPPRARVVPRFRLAGSP